MSRSRFEVLVEFSESIAIRLVATVPGMRQWDENYLFFI